MANVGFSLDSGTTSLQPIEVPADILEHNLPDFGPEKRLIIVDTPGFDDSYMDDLKVLGRIIEWLHES